ncbi:MAG: right-handed parallel beta-helix repeat-containing protein [Candidatus Bathyarchaeota archaeon]|nr:right-handed parallel beta-helix repeat-containing protein [Candidatus Bathyarchaeum sp.]
MRRFKSKVVLLLFLSLCLFFQFKVNAQPNTIVVPDDYQTIAEAVDNAFPGDTVFVRTGNYAGGIALNKPITLKGEDAESTIIVGGTTLEELSPALTFVKNTNSEKTASTKYSFLKSDTATQLDLQQANLKSQLVNFIPPITFGVYINSSDVTVSGFTLMGGTRAILGQGDRLQIKENVSGSCILGGSDIVVANNTRIGLQVSGFHNLIAGNIGSLVLVCSNSTIFDNSLNTFDLENAYSNIIVNNTLSGANMGLWIGSSITSAPKKCSYNLFAGNKIENCGLWGILMGDGSYNVFFGNIVQNTGVGIDHDGYGLALGGNHLVAENNLFLRNIFVNNSKNFGTNWDVEGTNSFDDGNEGNYWDDYLTLYPNASELAESGTGDTPYLLGDTNVDNHPLLNQPTVSDKVTTLPEPWSSLLSNPNAPLISENDLIPAFSSWIVLPLFLGFVFVIVVFKKKNGFGEIK